MHVHRVHTSTTMSRELAGNVHRAHISAVSKADLEHLRGYVHRVHGQATMPKDLRSTRLFVHLGHGRLCVAIGKARRQDRSIKSNQFLMEP